MKRIGEPCARIFVFLACLALFTTNSTTSGGLNVSRPYVATGFERGVVGDPWVMTPTDARLFQFVRGYKRGKALRLVVTGSSGGPNGSSELTSIWMLKLAHAGWNLTKASESTWYRLRLRFPARRYRPTAGQWNWLVVWHNDDRTSAHGAYSIAMGVYTDVGERGNELVGRNGRLALRLMGGSVAAPQAFTTELRRNSLRYNHWYDILFHFVWSPDPRVGVAEWWIDGVQRTSMHFPTLYTLPDGTKSYNSFGLYNYRLHASWTSQVDFDNVRIGPDRPSVGR